MPILPLWSNLLFDSLENDPLIRTNAVVENWNRILKRTTVEPPKVGPPKVGCKIGVFSKLQLNEPPKVGFLSEVGCGVRLLKF